MQLTRNQIEAFGRDGYLLLPELFSRPEIDVLRAEVPVLLRTDDPSRVMERDGRLVRSVYGCHRTNAICDQLTRHPRLLQPARDLLGSEVYVHQFKINAKAALGGDHWEWHQDYIFWRNEDGMPANRVLNVAIYLDEVTEFNGPMLLLPGSHHEGVIEPKRASDAAEAAAGEDVPAWHAHLNANLAYALDAGTIRALVTRWGMCAPKGPAGTVLMFDANVVHGSSPNMSPFDRNMAIVTFNSVENTLPARESRRPEFLAARDFRPLLPVADDVWAEVAHARVQV